MSLCFNFKGLVGGVFSLDQHCLCRDSRLRAVTQCIERLPIQFSWSAWVTAVG